MNQNVARTAVVTGAARGIGAAIARRLADEGMQVALFDLGGPACESIAEEINQRGGHAIGLTVDVADETAVESAIATVADTLGAPTVLVNNAGIIRDNLLFKMSADDWEAVMDVHLRGAFLLSRAVQRHMVIANWGRIINISSGSALGNRGQANYSSAKAGLMGFTKTLAIELGQFNVTVNAIAPGFVETDMAAQTASRMGLTLDELRAHGAAQIPVGRVGLPADIAAATAYFAREDSSYVSGQVLYVAGGPLC